MENKDILAKIDHTTLKPITTWEEVDRLCLEAIEYNMASVCIPPSYVKRVKDKYNSLNVCTVIGFPLGYNTTDIKVKETEDAIKNGATEIDMVVNICEIKNKNFEYVKEEISKIKKACGLLVLKVIVETCYLTNDEKIRLCEIISEVNAEYIKTSTGFGSAGADIEDIKLFKQNLSTGIKMKASGGIRTKEDMEKFINEGCDRIGSSSAMSLL